MWNQILQNLLKYIFNKCYFIYFESVLFKHLNFDGQEFKNILFL